MTEQLKDVAINAKGSFLTKDGRKNIMGRFALYLKENNIQIKTIEQIKTKYIEGYIQQQLASGKSLRSLHNEMSALRISLRTAGRDKLANSERIGNKALGFVGASRKGTKVAITDEQYNEYIKRHWLKMKD